MTYAPTINPEASDARQGPLNPFASLLPEDVLPLSPKPYVDLGAFTVETFPRVKPSLAKLPGSTELSDVAIERNAHDLEILSAHRIVMDGMSTRIDDEVFKRSTLYFEHRNWGVRQNELQAGFSSNYHIDGFLNWRLVRAMALYFDGLAPHILHNSVQPSDIDKKGKLTSVEGTPLAEVELDEEQLPTNHLLLMPNIPHRGTAAERWTPKRRLMRWLLVDES